MKKHLKLWLKEEASPQPSYGGRGGIGITFLCNEMKNNLFFTL